MRNGVNLERFDPDRANSLRGAWGMPEDAVVAGFLGMLRKIKRPELVLEACWPCLPTPARTSW